ncbi:MAG: type II toxin-antitoxin system VapC family toxin [Leptolyngbyaceae cyanobacterium bins.59]|nr:type II toxin-antitoxin system VapC family toxin [Leptolyngbyaceae cyanobacterium bins.59]
MGAVVADTHSLIWYLQNSSKLSATALNALDSATQMGDPVYVSSITVVEIVYLTEKGKLPQTALDQLINALSSPKAGFIVVSLDLAIAQTLSQVPKDIVPDMPDRIIAATALHLKLPLVTRDHKIQVLTAIQTIW